MSKTQVRKSQQTNEFPKLDKKDRWNPPITSMLPGGRAVLEKNSTQPDYLIWESSVPRRTAAYANLRPEVCFACDSF